jgi:hypothetical protein
MITSAAGRKPSFAEKILPSFMARECCSWSEGSGREQGRGEPSHFRAAGFTALGVPEQQIRIGRSDTARCSTGLAAARAEGRIGGRRKRREIAGSLISARKVRAADIARLYNVSAPTVSRIVAAHRSDL